jgi:ABC-type lipoprotein export system ATPase subunit
MDLESITALSSGAQFYRADLHIHSYGGSYDVTDASATPEQIVATAAGEKLSIVAIADHNEISNVPRAIKAVAAQNLLLVPAVELSMSDGHLLCYLPTYDALEKFFNSLQIADRRTKNCRCQTGTIDCLNNVASLCGFAIFAHVDADGGFEQAMPRLTPAKIDILCHRALLGFEVTRADADIKYTDQDTDSGRRQIAQTRIDRQRLGTKQFLARVLNSDAHTVKALGRNAKGDRRVTRYKMERPSFDGLVIAMLDADARVRIEDEIPPSIPKILGVGFSGGFLPDQAIHFSQNLNCIIGGRGSGKSTTFESVRLLTGTPSKSAVIDSDVWPEEITLLFEDQAGQRHVLSRTKDGSLENLDDPLEGPTSFRIESYGQGETHEISQRAQNDPMALLTFVDRLVDVDDALEIEDAIRTELNGLQPEMEKAERNVASISQVDRELKVRRSQLAKLKEKNGEAIITLQQRLESERCYRATIAEALRELPTAVSEDGIAEITDRIKEVVDVTPIEVGAAEFQSIVAATDAYKHSVLGFVGSLKQQTSTYSRQVVSLLEAWKGKEIKITNDIEVKKKELAAAGIRLDMPFIQKLVSDESRLAQSLKNLNTWRPHLLELQKKRTHLRKRRWEQRARVAALRAAFARKASDALASSLAELYVSLKFEHSAFCPDGERLINETMGWRTLQQLKSQALIQTLTLPKLIAILDKADAKALTALKNAEGRTIFGMGEAQAVIEKLNEPQVRWELDTCAIHDLPKLNVTKPVKDAVGKTVYVTREFKKLSLGQQQSVLLALMLTSDNNTPLIIDQPEDNLDSEFIYYSLVPVLRRAKERRQIIIVTHNPNVAVLGDAEQIVALRATNERGQIFSRGSIDDTNTRNTACAILEGSREAFDRRARIYGTGAGE